MYTYILYNPHSGNGSGLEEAHIVEVFQLGETIIQDITEIDDYKAFFSLLDDDDKIILCGGDGTLNHFCNDIAGLDIPCEILYYPIGTGNDFAHDVGERTGANPFTVNQYLRGLPTVSVNGEQSLFINGIGYGIDGYCCEIGDKKKEEQKAKGKRKPINYTAIAIGGLLFHFKPRNATVTVDGVSHRFEKVWIAATMKGRYYGGGMMVAPDQNRLNEDKKLTLVILHGSGKLKTLVVFPSIFKGEHIKHTEMTAVLTGHDISVSFDEPCPLQIDGETRLNVKEYRATSGVQVKENIIS